MFQVVLDTNVVIAALRSNRGASYALLEMVGKSLRFQINLSVPLLLEYEDVALRDLTTTGLTSTDVEDILDYLCSVAGRHSIFYLWRPQLKDPKDDFILELAVRAECDVIVTFNTRDFAGSERFGIRVMTPKEFLTLIRSET
jgi:putative PIN family toxin of toxin-antitoxin system